MVFKGYDFALVIHASKREKQPLRISKLDRQQMGYKPSWLFIEQQFYSLRLSDGWCFVFSCAVVFPHTIEAFTNLQWKRDLRLNDIDFSFLFSPSFKNHCGDICTTAFPIPCRFNQPLCGIISIKDNLCSSLVHFFK